MFRCSNYNSRGFIPIYLYNHLGPGNCYAVVAYDYIHLAPKTLSSLLHSTCTCIPHRYSMEPRRCHAENNYANPCARITKPCARLSNPCARFSNPCTRLSNPCSRFSNPCARISVINSCARITKPCTRINNSCARISAAQ